MSEKRARSESLPFSIELYSSLLFLTCLACLASGCSMRRRPNIPWATAVQVRPVLRTSADAAGAPPADAAPEIGLATPPFASVLVPLRGGPPRPRSSAPPSASASAEADAEKPEAPLIAPQLTPQEAAAARQEMNQSVSIAERNLARTRGKTLNATQSDLVSKIKGFLKDAREAAQSGDWSLARSLAKKAQVLSEELLGSV